MISKFAVWLVLLDFRFSVKQDTILIAANSLGIFSKGRLSVFSAFNNDNWDQEIRKISGLVAVGTKQGLENLLTLEGE